MGGSLEHQIDFSDGIIQQRRLIMERQFIQFSQMALLELLLISD